MKENDLVLYIDPETGEKSMVTPNVKILLEAEDKIPDLEGAMKVLEEMEKMGL